MRGSCDDDAIHDFSSPLIKKVEVCDDVSNDRKASIGRGIW